MISLPSFGQPEESNLLNGANKANDILNQWSTVTREKKKKSEGHRLSGPRRLFPNQKSLMRALSRTVASTNFEA